MHFLKSLSILAIVGMTSAYPTVEDTTPAALQARAALTAQTMVANINNITQQSQNLQPVVSSIQSNGLRRRQNNPFEPVINGLQAIINTATDDVTAMEGLVPYSVTTDEQDICDAFHNVSVCQPSTTTSSLMPSIVRPCPSSAPEAPDWKERPLGEHLPRARRRCPS